LKAQGRQVPEAKTIVAETKKIFAWEEEIKRTAVETKTIAAEATIAANVAACSKAQIHTPPCRPPPLPPSPPLHLQRCSVLPL